ncbi:Rieske 2Fe-2S domain-containing protein [Actinophytocola glycyrrhizae]|uniref:Cytochrome bc1 complex Rieske iron-sulfur subunit n=1 Tax=Actinophytocola glycyrrhizae TaxID=2044873 RepID=A0ABV9S2E4_9PSEU
MSHEIPRRAAVGFAVVGAACAACTRYGAPAAQPETRTTPDAPPQLLGKAIDVPVNGGVVFRDQKLVVTQPAEGEFRGFSAVCPHQGCIVDNVAAGTINCDCHGSKFALDGSVTTGPATRPLPPVEVSVNERGDLVTGTTEPGTTEPGTTEPGTTEPGTTEPPAPPEQAPTTGAPEGLASTGDIPVGGGAVFQAEQVVITQPSPGEFRAYSAVCTHQGCLVNEVAGGTINCDCHGSKFALDGSVSQGPASAPLPPVAVKVTGDQISLA